MFRILTGGVLGGIAQYLIGFLFWGTPLSAIAYSSADEAQNAAVQNALAQNLPATGTYIVPSPGTPGGTTLFGQGPIATIHYNTAGFPVTDSTALIAGLVMSIVAGILMAFALGGIASRVTGFGDRLRVVILFAAAFTLYLTLGQPVFNHYGWGYFIYLALGDFLGLVAAGAVIAKLLPKAPVV